MLRGFIIMETREEREERIKARDEAFALEDARHKKEMEFIEELRN